MQKHLFYFLSAFALGCVVALAARTAVVKPYDGHTGHPAMPDYKPMVTNPAAPAAEPSHGTHSPAGPQPQSKQEGPAEDPHAGRAAVNKAGTVNSVCAICGMDVDPTVKPESFEGKLVGFGCRLCPPKFKADPALYGPAALQNRVIEN